MAVDLWPSVDMEGFNVSMEEARQKARNARYKAGGKSIVLDANATSHLRNKGLASINDSLKFQHEVHSTVVKAIYTGSEFVATASGDEDFGLVLESTSFYAEQGGQIYDTGSIEGPSGSFTVNNVQVFGGYVLHICSFLEGPDSKALSVGDEVKCKVDYTRRTLTAPNHTCTHMPNFALRDADKKGLGATTVESGHMVEEVEGMEEGYLAKVVQGDGAKEIKVEEHVLSDKMEINGENEISWEKEAFEPSDSVCSDRGGCFGSKKGKLNYISKMNFYLRADCVSDMKPISDRETRHIHSRYEVLKEICCDLAEIPSFLSTCASIKSSDVDIVTQIFMDIYGSTISLQENLSKLDINLLSEIAFVRLGMKPRDFYSTYAGKVLEPNRLLSCYQIPRDSTIKLNARLRGGWYVKI
ncbi:alanine--tRNA ligase, cytoplasmic-like [Triticum dicoccoides]|uniref:alanine--tRNA ligase, cytoplasmic-like n=1 Tax=Triticum dicoccoides TaxID=85692 RepID=UPI0018917B0A|nr:alanine--tRNA ligase, cytoplasmic-like [Triticum dicoccoides]